MRRRDASRTNESAADVCLFLEGTYPYVSGGVSVWVQDLLQAQSHLTFHLVALVADRRPRTLQFEIPPNVIGLSEVVLQEPVASCPSGAAVRRLIARIGPPLARLLDKGGLADLRAILAAFAADPAAASRAALLNSEAAWAMIVETYQKAMPGASFLDFFWSWRGLAGGLFATLLAPLPKARVYHAVSTGYAGIMLARAALESRRPAVLTEHGIYTNERRVEIAMAEWLTDRSVSSLDIDRSRRDLRDLWIDAFVGYSHACYAACTRIVTLYGGNQELQARDGADPARLSVIPNGIDYAAMAAIAREAAPRKPTVALIGRVVPIKDVKTYIRAVGILRDIVPDVVGLILGPTDEDPGYVRECRQMAAHLGMADQIQFLGRVKLTDWLGRIDVTVLTSISEAQPLVLLEAGAAGVPTVATDVGACREMLLGREGEQPAFGPGGFVTPLSNPLATAQALAELLVSPEKRRAYGEAMRGRVEAHYNKLALDRVYHALYEAMLALPDGVPNEVGALSPQRREVA
jgi:glycosyltransferase involved in cell wall biosynthesis